jgi:CO/xanthine dehydrogenase FAD-binding subunit
VNFLAPRSLAQALEAKAEHPAAVALAGGTDLMVELNFGTRRPDAILDLTRVAELARWSRDDGFVSLGAGVTFTRIIEELADDLPGLAAASRTVGSPQIRNRATLGGNLGTASPAGDSLPPLMATGAEVSVSSVRGARTLQLQEFLLGPKRNALEADELITEVRVPVAAGPQHFSKIGTRNAMVIAVAAFSVAFDVAERSVGTGIGSAGPVVCRAGEAERFLVGVLQEEGLWESRGPLDERVAVRFGELVAKASAPIDDVRGTAAYRRHALAVMARRTLTWAWDSHRRKR